MAFEMALIQVPATATQPASLVKVATSSVTRPRQSLAAPTAMRYFSPAGGDPMAKTAGRGNPPWTRDETILALELFFQAGMVALSDTDERVIALSDVLRSLPGNESRAQSPSFRNPAGVAFKLSNIQSVSTGKGFANSSATDLAVWKHFESRPAKVKEVAQLIRTLAAEAPLDFSLDDADVEFPEGIVITTIHRRRERNRKLRKALLQNRRELGVLACDSCGITNTNTSKSLEDAIFEAHHLRPLSEVGKTKTRLPDVALLCANCHRSIHRLIASTGRWPSVLDLRTAIGIARDGIAESS